MGACTKSTILYLIPLRRPYRVVTTTFSCTLEPSSVYIGCSGWYYDAWVGHFYPTNSDHREFLKYYSQVFDFVEIDSSFYRPPNLFMTKRWEKVTPDNFRFTAKFHRSITHEKRLADPDSNKLRYFFDVMRPL